MAEQIKKDNRGFLYPNGTKTKPTQPDYTGTMLVETKEWRLAAWENQSSDGKKYLSIIVSPPLTPEQQNQLKRTDEPQAAPVKSNIPANAQNINSATTNNGVAPSSNNNSSEDYYNNSSDSSPSSLDDELDMILRSSDDDNPFN